ncbi:MULTISPECIES: hypothetical protein [Bacillus cereus group]|uniref:Uncharacterized protein n=1 Tax=Bacillus thuringiensis serovar mexicanensis TaxID=180868 RepID=A0A242WAL9_BACTU|nr:MULTISPECIES: hypothetical protein [Bacillus cereus group]EEM56713.1 hypothetical protein bthur0007_54880 [Bacillus thuringiensis serovar monterrey BGSC 4AJ1]MEB9673296.1 hypothetical protein [Bacillus anthracis]OTW50732.1 hypothetical protein BK699_09255 [Bacillus thuringiensis serovar mexicanensis]OTX09417.1 hypothetical protein BK705_04300 [Bacillus thuringiensis serovar monterrey]
MEEAVILKSYRNEFGKKIIKLSEVNTSLQPFWTEYCESFLSILSLYIISEKSFSNKKTNIPFHELMYSSYSLLDECKSWDMLNQKFKLAVSNEFKAIFSEDAFFYTSIGWEESENNKRTIVMVEAKKRLSFVINLI